MNNTIKGKGRMITHNGQTYSGDWLSNSMFGQGIYKWEGIVYEGELKNDMSDGRGKWTWPSGMAYEGEFIME